MPNVNIYLPGDIFRQVKKAKLPVSRICQAALVEALDGEEFILGEPEFDLQEHAEELRRLAQRAADAAKERS